MGFHIRLSIIMQNEVPLKVKLLNILWDKSVKEQGKIGKTLE